jgi:hypothetical protein
VSEPLQWSLPASPERPNEDAVFVRDGVAVVVDGAGLPKSMRAGCRHSVAWYANQVAAAFGAALLDRTVTMPQALSQAIVEVSQRHDGCRLNEGSPSATVAAWRLHSSDVEYLVLCDASAVVLLGDGAVEITDGRMAQLIAGRLAAAAGSGPLTASAILDVRRAALDASRNVEGGFWCCHTDPAAAEQALTGSYPRSEIVGLAIASDGATRGYQSLGVHTVEQLVSRAILGEGGTLIGEIRAAERQQRQRLLDSATKVHDDATIVALTSTARQPMSPFRAASSRSASGLEGP